MVFVLLTAFVAEVYPQDINGTWNGCVKVGQMELSVVFNIADGKCTMDSPDQGAFGIETEVGVLTADSINISIPKLLVNYAGRCEGGIIKGVFRQGGMPFELNLVPGNVLRNRPQTPCTPLDYKTEEVSFRNDKAGAKLSGTLSYPVGWNGTDKVPVVLMVTGSGQQNRDDEMFGHKPFLVIADYLAHKGIATLRYDDRGMGQSAGDATNATTLDFMEDAAAGIDYLRSAGKFGKIGVIGHSEGGMAAFMLAARDKVDFIVSMAGPGVRGDSIILEQNIHATGNACLSLPVLREVIKQKANPWLNFFIDYDPADDLARIKCPVLAVNGQKDIQVSSKVNLSAIRRNIKDKAILTTIEYPDLNHLFQHCTTGEVNEYAVIEETISNEVLKDISDFIIK